MERQEYPKLLYRKPELPLETILVNNEQEHQAAKLEGWGPHPSQREDGPPLPAPQESADPQPGFGSRLRDIVVKKGK